MQEGIDYKFEVSHEKDDFYSVLLLTGEWEGVIFRINQISLEERSDELVLKYDYNIEKGSKALEKDRGFSVMVGDIITNILNK